MATSATTTDWSSSSVFACYCYHHRLVWNRNQHHSLHLGSGERLASAPTLVVTVVPIPQCHIPSTSTHGRRSSDSRHTAYDRMEKPCSRRRETERNMEMPEHGDDGSCRICCNLAEGCVSRRSLPKGEEYHILCRLR